MKDKKEKSTDKKIKKEGQPKTVPHKTTVAKDKTVSAANTAGQKKTSDARRKSSVVNSGKKATTSVSKKTVAPLPVIPKKIHKSTASTETEKQTPEKDRRQTTPSQPAATPVNTVTEVKQSVHDGNSGITAVGGIPRVSFFTRNKYLLIAIVISLLIHGTALSVQFQHEKKPSEKPLSTLAVVLVNARHKTAPDQPQALAQANLDGGGNEDTPATPTSPIPPKNTASDGETLIDARQKVDETPVVQHDTLRQNKNPAPKLAEVKPQEKIPAESPAPSGMDLLNSVSVHNDLAAQIERDLKNYAERPRQLYISARTREYAFAQYIENWRQKVEKIGTLNYPQAARGRLYGEVGVIVSIRTDGTVLDIKITRSSGEKILDDAAATIIRMGSPYAAFPGNIKDKADILNISSTLKFTHANRLDAALSGN